MQRDVITFGGWMGINNVLDPSDLQPQDGKIVELVEANDVYIDNRLKVHTRPGTDKKLTLTNIHSLWSNGDVCLLVDNGSLKRLMTNYAVGTLKSGLSVDQRMSYADDKTGKIFMSNGSWIGYYENGVVSDLSDPTDQYKKKIPPGQALCIYNRQLYVGVDKFIFVSDPLKFNQYDGRNGFLVADGRVDMLAPVDDGIYVGEATVGFWGGPHHLQMARKEIINCRAIPNSHVEVSLDMVGDGSMGTGVLFATERGIVIGNPGGNAVNLTRDRYHPMYGFAGSAAIRQQDNFHQFILTIQS